MCACIIAYNHTTRANLSTNQTPWQRLHVYVYVNFPRDDNYSLRTCTCIIQNP